MKSMKIAVIGGGASGIMAAITAANQGHQVTIFEKNDRIGKKILATGNGRCNLTNLYQDINCYHSKDLQMAERILNQFPVTETLSFFETLGLVLKNKENYIYPYSEQASTVLDLLRMELKYQRVEILLQAKVFKILPKDQTFEVSYLQEEKKTLLFDKVILSTGSYAGLKQSSNKEIDGYEILRQLGHQIQTPYPSLVQLRGAESFYKSISGVRASTKITLLIDHKEISTEEGELQITEYGVSGIVIFQLSGLVSKALMENRQVSLRLDFLPSIDNKDYEQFSKIRLLSQAYKNAEEFFTGLIHKKLLLLFLKLAGLKPEDTLTEKNQSQFEKVLYDIKNFEIQIIESNGFEQAQVCGGGVFLSEFYDTLESKIVPGFYCCGEIMDVDGICGGYNLQWAWVFGYVAGVHASKKGIELDTH